VFEDTKLVFASDAERWSRKKNDSIIPDNLIKFAEEHWGVPNKVYFYEDIRIKNRRRELAGQKLITPFEFKYDTIPTEHHYSHACYGYYTSSFENCTVLVIDAIGEWATMTQWKVIYGEFKIIKQWNYPKSIGLFYSAMTQSAGWKPNEEEYILMGAAGVNRNSTFENYSIIRNLWDNGTNFHRGIDLTMDKFEIASATQQVYEEVFDDIISEIEDDNLIVVGGCALNVSANRLLYKKFSNVHIPCNPGDGGSAIGCVLARTKTKIDPSPYLGYDVVGKYPVENLIKELKTNGIAGVISGKAEFGPRALGNRSILADPSIINIKDRVNKIKGRDNFRPFAPMILKEDLTSYFKNNIYSPYMNTTFTALNHTRKMYPGIVHLDGTSRVQIVETDEHKQLLQEWKQESGCPMLLNTSLNIKGEPMMDKKNNNMPFEGMEIF